MEIKAFIRGFDGQSPIATITMKFNKLSLETAKKLLSGIFDSHKSGPTRVANFDGDGVGEATIDVWRSPINWVVEDNAIAVVIRYENAQNCLLDSATKLDRSIIAGRSCVRSDVNAIKETLEQVFSIFD